MYLQGRDVFNIVMPYIYTLILGIKEESAPWAVKWEEGVILSLQPSIVLTYIRTVWIVRLNISEILRKTEKPIYFFKLLHHTDTSEKYLLSESVSRIEYQ